jgi:hypothetical protein
MSMTPRPGARAENQGAGQKDERALERPAMRAVRGVEPDDVNHRREDDAAEHDARPVVPGRTGGELRIAVAETHQNARNECQAKDHCVRKEVQSDVEPVLTENSVAVHALCGFGGKGWRLGGSEG